MLPQPGPAASPGTSPCAAGNEAQRDESPQPGIARTQKDNRTLPVASAAPLGTRLRPRDRTARVDAPCLAPTPLRQPEPAAGEPFIPTSIGAGAPAPGGLCVGAACDAGSAGRATAASSAPSVPRRGRFPMGSIPSPVTARLEQNWSRAVRRRFSHILKADLVDTLTVSGCHLRQMLNRQARAF